ncbi:GDSL family lipase, partial [Raoultella planticola]
MALYKTGNPVPSSAMPDVWDNNRVQDEVLNSEELEVETRMGVMTPTWKGVLKKNDDAIEDARQNLIPLGRQYMTIADAQADIANIPEGSTTYYRSPDDSALAIEVINNGGTLEATGRKMPAQAAVDDALAGVTALNLLITDSYLPQGFSAAITDPEGNAAALINDGGGFEVP